MEIEIKNNLDTDGSGLFDVYYDGKIADQLNWEEMIGVIASLTIPDGKPCLQWLATPEQRKAKRDYFDSIKTRVAGEIKDLDLENIE